LVDPVIVYAERAQLADTPAILLGLWRFLLGAVTLSASVVLIAWAGDAPSPSAANTLPIILYALLHFIALYWAHTGLASVQIGCMRLNGYIVPERYVAVLAASDAADFWRRWNTYVGAWLRRYIFLPTALVLARRRRAKNIDKAFALLLAFACIGLLHDVFAYLERREETARGTLGFLAAAGSVLVWFGISRWGQAVRERLPDFAKAPRFAAAFVGRAYLWLTVVSAVWYFGK
jgi:hypothetical protein